MSIYTIYHNPRCSKSRQTLAILEQQGVEIEIIHYLETPPAKDALKAILVMLEKSPRDILRRGEEAYKTFNLGDKTHDDNFILEKMIEYPKLIERPIVVHHDRAVIGRPPEAVLQLID